MIRAPICTVVGHVDHGKTTLLDHIRGTAVAAGEAGAITQAIGASIIPIEHIKARASAMIGSMNLSIPGLLFIDTPGHAAFTSMRKRGGSLADIAVLIVDLNEGFKPQTREALEILRSYKTPFVIAANKIDKAPRFLQRKGNILDIIKQQTPETQEHLDKKLYELVGVLSEYGLNAERFDRISSFEEQVAIVPISALQGYGIDSLLAVIVGLAQRYLEQSLHAEATGPAKGTILEVSDDKGMGRTLNAIIYDGSLDVGDTIVIGALGEPVVTKVRALFQPSTVGDIRDRKTRFTSIKQAIAATGVKISAPDLEGVHAGMPFIEVTETVDEAKNAVKSAVDSVTIHTDEEGVILRADNIGSLEALINLLREKNIPLRSANVGAVTKKDLVLAASNPARLAVVMAFNVDADITPPDDVKVLQASIIYQLIDQYEEHVARIEEQERQEELGKIRLPARIELLANCIFRQSHPLICGVHVQAGTLKTGGKLVSGKDGTTTIGIIKEIQDKKERLSSAEQDSEVAIAIPGVIGGRQVKEGDVLWQSITEDEYRKLKDHAKQLTAAQKDLLREYAELMRTHNPMWGV